MAFIISPSLTETAVPLLSLTACNIKLSPIALGTRKPRAIVSGLLNYVVKFFTVILIGCKPIISELI